MKKRSLLFGFVAAMIAAFIFSGCESPTDGSAGASGADGVVPLSGVSGVVDASTLEAVFKVTDRVILLPGVTSVTGKIPAGKTLFVSGDTAVGTATTATLDVAGTLEIFEGAALNASGVSNAGYLWGTGSVTGEGEIGLPYLDGEVQGDDIPIIYTSANVSVAGKYAASYSTGGAPTAITADNLAAIFGRTGDGAITALTVKNIATLTAAAIPANKTLTLLGSGNTFAADLDLSAGGNLVVKGTLATSGEFALTGNATTANITIEGALALGEKGSIAGKIENNGVITSAATDGEKQAAIVSLAGLSGGGKVVLSGTGTTAAGTATLALTQDVEIKGTLKAPAHATPFSGGKTITVASGGTLDLDAAVTTLSGATIVNKGTVSTATTSAAALNTILDLKGNITSSGAVTGDAAITVPAETKLTIPSSASLAVSEGAVVAGTLDVSGTFTVAADANVEVASGGILTVKAGASGGDLNGTITVKSGGVSYDLKQGGGSLWGNNSAGEYVFESGAKAYISIGSDTTDLLIGGPTDDAWVQLAAGTTFSNSKTAYTLDGDVKLNRNGFGLVDTTLTIKAGTLTIGTDRIEPYPTLNLAPTTENPFILGEAGARIVVNSYIIIFSSWGGALHTDDISSLPHNFYSATGTKETSIEGLQGTYEWTANAGGENKPGWLKQQTAP